MSLKHSIESAKTEAAAVYLAALGAQAEIQKVGEHPFLIEPGTGDVTDLEHLLAAPLRQQTERYIHTVESFIDYLTVFKKEGSSIYVLREGSTYKAVAEIDHRSTTQLVWNDHKAFFLLNQSEALTRWLKNSGQQMSQSGFADLIEERSQDIVTPDAAYMLEIASDLQVTNNLSLNSVRRKGGGVNSVSFNQEAGVQGKDGVDLPNKFTITLQPFARHKETVRLEATLRVRSVSDRPVFIYELLHVDELVEEVVASILHKVKTQTGLPIYR